MEQAQTLLLQALKAAIAGRHVDWNDDVAAAQYAKMLELAHIHHVLPLVFEATYRCPAASELEPAQLGQCRSTVRQMVTAQSIRTAGFLELNRALQAAGVPVAVVKGLACRNLYPLPDHRPSGDEDLLCQPEHFDICHQVMISMGLQPLGSLDSYEVGYQSSSLYIELHKQLFPPESAIFGEWNTFFADTFSRCVTLDADGQTILTLDHTDHLLYLILHAFKHFLHSGFGIRQVCDMVLFAQAHGKDIRWEELLEKCAALRADCFAAALFALGRTYLGFDDHAACYPIIWKHLETDPLPLLSDLLNSGVYGSADMDRLHSSNITLTAVRDDKKGKSAKGNLIATLFPGTESLEGRFPYLQKHPWLLPVAWTVRLAGYLKESGRRQASAGQSLQTGKNRIELLRLYRIIR